MPTIRVKENEPFDVALRRFKRTIEKTGLITELRARENCQPDSAKPERIAEFPPVGEEPAAGAARTAPGVGCAPMRDRRAGTNLVCIRRQR